MRTYTAHLSPRRQPVLVREGWSWGAALFGPVWLLAHRAWIPAAIWLACLIAVLAQPLPELRRPLLLGLVLITGLTGRDLVRWTLARRGYVLAHVLAARDEDGAFSRLLAARQDLLEHALDPLA